ncbi:MAG: hypothetical protein WC455_17050 [Dehalococcoidia bacterium]|jgi:hypothetical protein
MKKSNRADEYKGTPDTTYLDMVFLELSQFTKAITGKEIHLAVDRDNWKDRALAYRDIIKRAKAANNPFGCAYVEIILDEADKIKEPK